MVVVASGRAWAVPADLAGSPRPLGPATSVAPGADEASVWLVSGESFPQRVVEVNLAGRRLELERELPPKAWFLHGAPDGRLVMQLKGDTVLWDPGDGRVVRRFGGTFLDARGSLVAVATCDPRG